MSAVIRPMTRPEYETWKQSLTIRYAESKKEGFGYSIEEAEAELKSNLGRLLPAAESTEGQFLMSAVVEDQVGAWIWFSLNADGTFFIYDLVVFSEQRKRGLGRFMMEYAESRARELGARRIVFQVFAHNAGAVRLFHDCGFATASHMMVMSLG